MTGSFGDVLYLLILTPSNQICSKYLFKYQHSVKCTTYDYDNILVFIYDDVDTYVAAIHCLRRTREGTQVGGESPHRWQLGLVGGGAGNRRNINIFRLWSKYFPGSPDDGAALGVGVVGGGVGLVLGAGGEVPPPQLRGLVLAAVLAALLLAADLAARVPAPPEPPGPLWYIGSIKTLVPPPLLLFTWHRMLDRENSVWSVWSLGRTRNRVTLKLSLNFPDLSLEAWN